MDKRLKIVLIGLIILLVTSLLFSFYALSLRTKLYKDYKDLEFTKEKLKEENKDLVAKVTNLMNEKRQIQKRIESLEKELGDLAKERDGLKNKYALIEKEKETLIQKIQELSEAAPIEPKPKEEKPEVSYIPPAVTDDEYWGGILRARAELEVKVEELKNELSATKLKFSGLETQRESLREELARLNEQRGELLRRVNENEKVTQNLSLELAKEKNEKRELDSYVQTLKTENTQLKEQLDQLKEKTYTLEGKLYSLEKDRLSLERDIGELKFKAEEVSSTETTVTPPEKHKTNVVQLSPIVVKAEERLAPSVSTPAQEVSGVILSINKENNFVIINLGTSSGIKPGSYLDVYRGNEKIARIQVIKMRDNVSACDIISASKDIKARDIVR